MTKRRLPGYVRWWDVPLAVAIALTAMALSTCATGPRKARAEEEAVSCRTLALLASEVIADPDSYMPRPRLGRYGAGYYEPLLVWSEGYQIRTVGRNAMGVISIQERVAVPPQGEWRPLHRELWPNPGEPAMQWVEPDRFTLRYAILRVQRLAQEADAEAVIKLGSTLDRLIPDDPNTEIPHARALALLDEAARVCGED